MTEKISLCEIGDRLELITPGGKTWRFARDEELSVVLVGREGSTLATIPRTPNPVALRPVRYHPKPRRKP